MTRTEDVGFEHSIPILCVRSLQASIDHYIGVLGFHVDWQGPGMCQVSRGRGWLMLCEGDQGHPGTWVWIGVHDATLLHAELSASGATIRLPPTNYPWACEIHVEDPDGHVLRLGSEPLEDRPFSPWIAWYRRGDGGS